MADLTALDMARIEMQNMDDYVGRLKILLRPDKLDCSTISGDIRCMRAVLDRFADAVFTVNREQRGSDEAIQKQQMLYKKEQERLAREARERAELEALKPVPFSLD